MPVLLNGRALGGGVNGDAGASEWSCRLDDVVRLPTDSLWATLDRGGEPREVEGEARLEGEWLVAWCMASSSFGVLGCAGGPEASGAGSPEPFVASAVSV